MRDLEDHTKIRTVCCKCWILHLDIANEKMELDAFSNKPKKRTDDPITDNDGFQKATQDQLNLLNAEM